MKKILKILKVIIIIIGIIIGAIIFEIVITGDIRYSYQFFIIGIILIFKLLGVD